MSNDDRAFYAPGEGAGVLEESINPSAVRLDQLSAADQKALVEKATALQQLLGDPKLAKYKIEVLFDRRKTTRGPFPGAMVVFESGSVLSGGGDEIVYPCPDDRCKGYISSKFIAPMSQSAFCVACKKPWRTKDLKEARFFVLDPSKWAFVIAREFVRTGCVADIYMKTAKVEDLRKRALIQKPGGENLAAARGDRDFVMYQLKNILTDVNAGSSIEARVRALITA